MKEKKYIQYAKDVVNGKKVAGNNEILMCQRFLDDLNNDKWDFREDKVEHALAFIATLKHFKGKTSGQHFILEGWQQFILANIIGFYNKGTDERRFTSSYIEVSRKNGKTALAAALCLYFLIADGEDGAEVILSANSREQANIAYEYCFEFAKQLDPKGKTLISKLKGISFPLTASKLKVIASDFKNLDGFNASFGLVDEFHSAVNNKIRDVIKSSMVMRTNPHLCTITTAGFDKSGPCYQLRSTAIEILHKVKTDDSMFIAIYCMDDKDDFSDEKNWIKAIPNLGITVSKKAVQDAIVSAKNNPSEEVGVKTKTLNIWCDSVDVWIPENYIIKSTAKVDLKQFSEDDLCYIGVDLSSTSDLTSVAYLIYQDDKYYFYVDYYLPESCLTDNPNRELYKEFYRNGDLKITNGNVVDYDYITNDILKRSEYLRIYRIGYDSWNATQWAVQCTELGLPLMEFSQSVGNFNKPTKEFERLILSGKCVIDNNEITRWCFRNVELKSDWNDNIKPTKGNDRMKKIDGVIAIIQSLGIYLQNPSTNQDLIVI